MNSDEIIELTQELISYVNNLSEDMMFFKVLDYAYDDIKHIEQITEKA